jgi:hypothetical protein
MTSKSSILDWFIRMLQVLVPSRICPRHHHDPGNLKRYCFFEKPQKNLKIGHDDAFSQHGSSAPACSAAVLLSANLIAGGCHCRCGIPEVPVQT